MKESVVLNAMPYFQTSPDFDMETVVDKFMEIEAKEHYMVLPGGNDIQNVEGLTVVEAREPYGMRYYNHSAILKVLEKEKPIPSDSKREENIYNIEEIADLDEKNIDISGKHCKKGVYAGKKEMTPKEIIELSGSKKPCKGVYFHFPMGKMVSEQDFDTPIRVLTDKIYLYYEDDCILSELLGIVKEYEEQSCGRCVFGFEGITQIQMILTDITLKKGNPGDIDLLLSLYGEMKRNSLCEVGICAADTVISTITKFRGELEEHITKKTCKAAVCSRFVTFHILADQCIGCGDCMDECEEDAISGKKKFIHVIDNDECIGCGACIEACEEEAIVKAGPVKPRCPKKPIPCKKR